MSSDSRLYLTHIEDQHIANESEVNDLIECFPGEVHLVNEFGEGKEIYGEGKVPEGNCLDTKVGLGEPKNLPDKEVRNIYFGGFNFDQCLGATVETVVEERGEDPNYHVLEDYSFTTNGDNLVQSLDTFLDQRGWNDVDTVGKLREKLSESDSSLDPSRYPQSTSIMNGNQIFL